MMRTQSGSVYGHSIVFSSSRHGFKDEATLDELGKPQPYGDLIVMRPNASGLRQLTDNEWEDGTPTSRPELRSASARPPDAGSNS